MKRIYVLVLLFIFLVCLSEAQKKSKDSKKASSKSSKSKSSSKPPKNTGKTQTPAVKASSGPSESLKLAEDMVALAKRLLKAIKAGEQMPAPLCPNGLPQVKCSPLSCDKWTCSNILNTECSEQCHVCEPKFFIGGSDVTHICDIKLAAPKSQAGQSPPTSSRNNNQNQSSRTSGTSGSQQMPPMPGMAMMFSENPMPMAGPPGMEFMPNFENFPPGMSPMQFFHHLQNMPAENSGSRQQQAN